MTLTTEIQADEGKGKAFQGAISGYLATFPWWTLAIAFLGLMIIFRITTDETYTKIFNFLRQGVVLTIQITATAYLFALFLGLTTGLMQLSDNVILRNVAQLYVQVVRGVPIIVQITYWVIVIFPMFVDFVNGIGVQLAEAGTLAADNALITWKVSQITRGIVALSFSYGAFSSEIFRAGIQSIEKGQTEASKALGLNWFQTFRHVILPQALRRVMPPLGNDFIAMLKESSLLSVIGINEITLQSKQYAARSFLFLETYTTGAFLYLSMTLLLSMGVRYMERRMSKDARKG
jgi:His/Glu/Gln/Arg/opine family amino acid ABC transporter permease subunit